MHFASDNAAGVAPAILEAIRRANEGYAIAYGNDDLTTRVERRFAEVFEREVAVFLVPTGTAANALALAHLAPPWGAVLCHPEAHIATSECGAPEFFGGGLKLVGLPGDDGKVSAAAVREALKQREWGGPHHVTPSVLSLTQASEVGTIYQSDELASLSELVHRHGMSVHVDGARFANALAALGATPAQATWKTGVDVLSLGATKGGALAAEAVVFFDKTRAAAMGERRKRGGQLISKHRFLAAQFDAFFADDLWLKLAHHANRLAARLGKGLAAAGIAPVWPVEANLVFAVLPAAVDERLRAAGASYYAMQKSLPKSAALPPGAVLARLVTSFSTREAEVDRFTAIAAGS